MANGKRKMGMFLAALFTAFTCMSYMPANAATKTTKKVATAATINYNAAVKAVVDYEKAVKNYKLTSKTNLDFCAGKYKVAMAALGKLNTKAASTKALVNRVLAAKKVWTVAYNAYVQAEKDKGVVDAATALVQAMDAVNAYEIAPITTAEEITKAEALKQPAVDAIAKVKDEAKAKDLTERVTKRAAAIEVKKAEIARFRVESVKAISATEVMVKFSQVVDKTSAQTVKNYSVSTAQPNTAVLQDDKKSVLLTFTGVISGTVAYTVQPISLAADTDKTTDLYTAVETYSDTTAPAVAKVEYPTYDQAEITFSEPVKGLGNVTITQNGADVKSLTTITWSDDKKVATVDLADAGVVVDKPISVIFVGATDMANNLMNPNPTTVTLTKTKTDAVKPAVASVKALSNSRIEIVFSEKIKVAPATVTANGEAVTLKTDDNITFIGTMANPKAGIGTIVISGNYKDMSGNTGDTYTSGLLQFVADTTAPELVGNPEIVNIDGTSYLVLHFNEEVAGQTVDITTGTRVKDYVSYGFTAKGVAFKGYVNGTVKDSKSVMVDISNDTAFPVGTYTISLPVGAVVDTAVPNTNKNAAKYISFTKVASTSVDTGAPTVKKDDKGNYIAPVFSDDNSKLTVVFSEPMDPTTALNVANYKVGGMSIFSKAVFVENAYTVELTVTPGTIVYGGNYSLSISGAKDKAGNDMKAYTTILEVRENVKPFIDSAKLTAANIIAVTMSEEVTGIDAAADFEIYVGTTKLDPKTDYTVTYEKGVATIKLTTALTDLSKAVTVKLIDTTVADLKGNTVVDPVVITVK